MDLMQNPFYVLTATSRDNRSRIIELADERSLLIDSNICMEARSELTTPRKRLAVEIAWLQGVAPKRIKELLEMLQATPEAIFAIKELNPLSRVNVLIAALSRLESYTIQNIVTWTLEIAQEFEKISPEDVLSIINEDRTVAGFPEISDVAVIEEEIEKQRKYYRNIFKCAFDKLLSQDLIAAITSVIDTDTDNGEDAGSALVYDLIDLYEIEVQPFLDEEEKNIEKTLELIKEIMSSSKSDIALAKAISKMEQVLRNWDKVAQPIQLNTKSKGLDHDASRRIAIAIRGVAIYLFNEHDKLEESQEITEMLQDVFAEVVDIVEMSENDANALADIALQKVKDEQHSAEWEREITYEAEVGLVFKDTLRISPRGVEWKGDFLALDSITRVRWGAIKNSTGITYTVVCGSQYKILTIEIKKDIIFSNFISRIWKAVGTRLLVELLVGLRNGESYQFGSAILTDTGFKLKRGNSLSSSQYEFCPWQDIVTWNGNGHFCVRSNKDFKLSAYFSYINLDNIHILESAISMLSRKGCQRLSDILEG